MIPTIISEDLIKTIPESTVSVIHGLRHFVVERARTARRYLKLTQPPYAIQDLTIIEIDKKHNSHLQEVKHFISKGISFGIISESGMPGVADPGATVISLAHRHNCNVKPLVGPSSILLSLAASGLNGQNFFFHGYLPIKEPELRKKLKAIVQSVKTSNLTHIFIETPYRNDRLLKFMIDTINSDIILCIASDITGKHEMIRSQPIHKWKNQLPKIGKLPTIFLLGS